MRRNAGFDQYSNSVTVIPVPRMRELGLFDESNYVKMSDAEGGAVCGAEGFLLGPDLDRWLAIGKWQHEAWGDAILIAKALRAGAVEDVDNEDAGEEGGGIDVRVSVGKSAAGDFKLEGRVAGSTAGGLRASDIVSANNAYTLPIERGNFADLAVPPNP